VQEVAWQRLFDTPGSCFCGRRSGASSAPSDLGVTEQSLRDWVRQHEVDVGQRPGLSSDQCEELKRLRRENRLLHEEREILKKAAASGRVAVGEDPCDS